MANFRAGTSISDDLAQILGLTRKLQGALNAGTAPPAAGPETVGASSLQLDGQAGTIGKGGASSAIAPSSPGTQASTSVPAATSSSVSYSEPTAPPASERMIEVAGSGMGADKKFKMTEGEALAVYRTMRDGGGNLQPEQLAAKLKEKYGIDAEATTIDGKKAVVNKATGNTIAIDTNGNGSLEMADMNLKEALLAAGIDPDWKADPKVFDLATKVVSQAIEASQKRREEEEAARLKKAEAAGRIATATGTGVTDAKAA